VSHHHEQQQPGLGGALFAVYGVASDTREIRVPRYIGHFVATMLKHARDRFLHAGRGSKLDARNPVRR